MYTSMVDGQGQSVPYSQECCEETCGPQKKSPSPSGVWPRIGSTNVVYTGVEEAEPEKAVYQSDLCGWVGQIGYDEHEDVYGILNCQGIFISRSPQMNNHAKPFPAL